MEIKETIQITEYPIDALPRHTISYKIMTNLADEDTERSFQVYASPEEIEQFGKQGYLVRKGLFSDEQLQRYRDALDEVEAAEVTKEPIGRSGNFGGWFPRYLFDKHEAFHDLIDFAPFVSVAQAMLGPFVRIRQLGGRVALSRRTESGNPLASPPSDNSQSATGLLFPSTHPRLFDLPG